MPIIALTGGIGSGKSEAAKQFAVLGIAVVDTDVISHALTAAGQPVLGKISLALGPGFVTPEGILDRAKLRAHVFDHPEARFKLEALLHPAIHAEAVSQLAYNEKTLQPVYQIVVVPLLFECDRFRTLSHHILVIDCNEDKQLERTMARSQLTKTQVEAIMAAQVSRAIRLEHADYVIENNGTQSELLDKVVEFHENFIKTCIVSK
ncbi:MAG: dephospho-CoA kinase [Methylotenera sp.]|nr:dephospho-CoA kinase [Methylotenera sp.]